MISLQQQIEEIGKKVNSITEATIKREALAQIDSLEQDIETIVKVIYEGPSASTLDIQKVQAIIARIESHLEEARKKAAQNRKRPLKEA